MKQTLFMETTQVPPEKTAGEIMGVLVKANARQIAVEYDAERKLSGMSFVIVINGNPLPFRLPARIEPVFRALNDRRPKESWYRGNREEKAEVDRQQAERVAWRQLLRWVQAQLAMIETGMVASEEVFLPYLQNENGQTVYQLFAETKFKMLPAPKEPPTPGAGEGGRT